VNHTQLETERLTIRGFHADDWRDLYEYLSQPETVQYEPYEPFSPDEAKREAERRANDENFYAVCLKESAKLIGNIYLAKRDFDAAEIGFVFNSKFGRKGYATEAATALIDRLFAENKAHRVFAECNPENERSWKLLERLRFRRERYLRQNIFFKRNADGSPIWQDTYIYGVLAAEWPDTKKMHMAIALGAVKPDSQYGGEDFVTLFDPEGHPSCPCKK
jgi:RimJ/RimL family protein N-acetyltransferase